MEQMSCPSTKEEKEGEVGEGALKPVLERGHNTL